jgi:hypothetical protein
MSDAYTLVQPAHQSIPLNFMARINANHRYCRHSDPRQVSYAQDAREFIRKKLIGKNVKVHIDFVRPREGEFDERECATIRYGGHNA